MRELSLPAGCISDLVLDEWIAGELEVRARVQVEQHLSQCTRCQGRHAGFLNEQRGFFAAAPDLAAHAELLGRPNAFADRAPNPRARSIVRWMIPASAALAGCLAAVLWLRSAPDAGTRVKGGLPHLGFFVKRGTQIHRGQSGETVRAGDQLRFTYTSDQARYLALFDRDEHGASVYFPAGDRAIRVAPGSDIALDFSVELDDSAQPERLYAVFCPDPFAIEPIRAALSSSPQVQAPAQCHVTVTELHREPPR